MQTKKQQKWWKRSLNTFLATALVASSISFVGFPQEVKAATNDTPISSPAGVDGAVLWLRPDKGISIESGQTVSEWQDQSNTGNHATQNTTTLQPMYRNDAQYNVNFNPMLEFNNKYFNLDVNKLPTGNSSRTIVAVAASENNTGDNRYIISWGTASLGSMIGMLQLSGTTKGAMSIFGGSFSSEEGFWQKNVPNELVATYDGTNGALYSKTTQIGKAKQSWNTANTQARVGRIIGGGRAEEWIGTIGDIIVYDRALDEAERKQISSYLAIKYGYTLDVEGLPTNSKKADYLASDTSILWDATANADYYHSIAGIARDDNGGLLQKQSNSTNPGNQVVIGLNEINDKNSSNPAQFSTDMQYLMWGDNNLPFAYTQPTNDGRAHTERIWKVQNRGNVGQVEFAIPKDALPEKGALLVGNEDFSSNTEYPLTWKTINGKEYYTTKLTFTDGQYFTLVTTKPELEKATLTQTVTDNNEVTLIFDQSVTLTDLNGFTITKDGIEIPIGNVTYKIDGNTIVLTLPTNENVTGESVINVEYKKATGNLIGKTNSLPVGDFKIQAINSFAASLTIETPTSTIVTTPQPEIKGKVEVGSDVEVVIKDKQGNVIPNVGSKASVDANGNWTFTPGIDLVDGDYTIEVEATKDGKTAKETKGITVNTSLPTIQITEPAGTVSTTKPDIKGTVDPDATVKVVIKDKNGNVVPNAGGEATVDANGNWTFTPGIDLVDGDYTIEVEATKDGKTAKETKGITVNTSSPTIQITEPAGTVSTTKPDIKGTVDPDATVKVVIKDKNGNVVPNAGGEATVDANGNWTFTPGIDLVDGDYTIEVEAIKDGKTAKETKGITVNTVTPSAPIVVITEPIEGKVETSKPEFKGMGTPGSTVTVEIKDKAGNVIDTPLVTVNPDGTWSFVPTNNLRDGDYTVEVTAKKDGETTSINKTITINTKTLPIFTPSLSSLIPSQGVLNPSFSPEVTNYSMNVDYLTSQLSFLAIPSNLGVSVTTTVNGQPGTLGQIPLQVGENIIIITVTDTNGNVRHYTIKVYREAYTGGGTWTPDPTPNPTTPTTTEPSTTTTKIQVALEIDGDNPLEKTTVEIERTKHANGEITDFVALTETNAKEAVKKAKQIGNNVARIVIPDVNDEVDKVTVEIPKQSLQLLRDNGLSLEISTENGLIAIPLSSMNGVDDNFYFRLVPVKKESERKAIEERARAEKVVRETLQSNDVNVMARPMTIETNMPSRLVQVTLPLRGVKVPTVAAERQVFLDQLAVFIEHSDGEKKVVFPEVVTMVKGELGLRFTVDKFSTFTVIQFTKPTVGKHEVYIKGFPNGTFGPEENVTRAQVATMIARLLGYTDDQTIDYAPFKDIPSNHYAAGAIAFVKERGIMNGDMNGNFRASENITRAQMATVVANYKHLQIEEGVEITFNDTKGHWAQWIIEANRTAGIINGRQDGSFAPNEHLTRAQAVVMMNRMFERGPLNGVTTPSFQDVKATHWAFKEIEEAAKSHSYVIDEDDKEQLSK
ncbi:Cellulosome-anchoring protein [Lysinibacillus sphaericus]|uniref:Cellulosome-anchoring protein n=1 Tax=Lysinibacillus sphaericus TaxID=1421 RepID=A0A2S5CV36_LYSSH|nr:Ig-like domain-containing protein [Lysinibacillus sphaericus]POZ54675.1 Cellulosome-anchoring protein [Lysinibacillus sphaericus]